MKCTSTTKATNALGVERVKLLKCMQYLAGIQTRALFWNWWMGPKTVRASLLYCCPNPVCKSYFEGSCSTRLCPWIQTILYDIANLKTLYGSGCFLALTYVHGYFAKIASSIAPPSSDSFLGCYFMIKFGESRWSVDLNGWHWNIFPFLLTPVTSYP